MAVGAVLFLPLGIAKAGTKLLDPVTIGLGAAVAVLSSVLPYTLELLALRRLPASTFAVLMSLEPAIAATAGFLLLDQALTHTQALAIALVIAASMGAVRTQVGRGSRPGSRAVPDGGRVGACRRAAFGSVNHPEHVPGPVPYAHRAASAEIER
ncbi:hypothetical protein SGLAM104S_06193 [Streptomyces glaucescens]